MSVLVVAAAIVVCFFSLIWVVMGFWHVHDAATSKKPKPGEVRAVAIFTACGVVVLVLSAWYLYARFT